MARASDVEEATWLAFLIAYLSPLEGEDPWASIAAARTSWASGELPMLEDVALGPRTAHDPARGASTLLAYRAWAAARRLSGAGLHRRPRVARPAPLRPRLRAHVAAAASGARRATSCWSSSGASASTTSARGRCTSPRTPLDPTVVASKRVLGIGDPLLLQRRAAELVEAVGVPIEALDLGLTNWSRPEGERITAGATVGVEGPRRDAIGAALRV